jgi:hypothetical protein
MTVASSFSLLYFSVSRRACSFAHSTTKVGRNGMAVCPFHPDKNPSTKLDKRYHCFACQADGDVIDFGLSGGGKEH